VGGINLPSDIHQLLVRIVTQKMVFDGFHITHWEGKQSAIVGGGEIDLPIPFKIGRHRPDVVGFNKQCKIVGVGEAKTLLDLDSIRTGEQLVDFSSAYTAKSNICCKFYFAVPSNALLKIKQLLVRYNLHGRDNIHLISVPDVLLLRRYVHE
jgi:hypothetical protein